MTENTEVGSRNAEVGSRNYSISDFGYRVFDLIRLRRTSPPEADKGLIPRPLG